MRLKKQRSIGFTLLELLIAVALVFIIATLAISSYGQYRERVNIAIAISDIEQIEGQIDRFLVSTNGRLPSNGSEINIDSYLDPWGNPYQYLNIAETQGNGPKRKDRNLVPINSDYDLYSKGPDGRSVSPLVAPQSHDDIIRANNGNFVGIAEDY